MNIEGFDTEVKRFLSVCNKHNVRMLMVGGGAVNFHGYRRHSADIDFWIDTSEENMKRLLAALIECGYEVRSLPDSVKRGDQNVSVKFSPGEIEVELITRFSINKSFEEAVKSSELHQIEGEPILKLRVLSFEDLIASKVKSGRPKDLLDIRELKRIREDEE